MGLQVGTGVCSAETTHTILPSVHAEATNNSSVNPSLIGFCHRSVFWLNKRGHAANGGSCLNSINFHVIPFCTFYASYCANLFVQMFFNTLCRHRNITQA
ncbi:Uncharacterised protein [Vibrio cholerae]|nr:Uncharacterised protein [Vibrio cholerae]CSB99080.1 Uncharacterised protein [Vibrio cholerae]CSE03778.1 Uncharacterised protein [Vibrio cholerae]CSI41054.1 Uncharacterised protein [Vibrio cholerae]